MRMKMHPRQVIASCSLTAKTTRQDLMGIKESSFLAWEHNSPNTWGWGASLLNSEDVYLHLWGSLEEHRHNNDRSFHNRETGCYLQYEGWCHQCDPYDRDTCTQAWSPDFYPWIPQVAGEDQNPKSCSLTSRYLFTHAYEIMNQNTKDTKS